MDIENIDDNTKAEDMVLAGITLLVRTLFEDWAKDFKQSLFDMIEEVLGESDIITDLQHVTNKLSDEAVSAAQMHEAIGNIETQADEGTLESLISAQGSMDALMTDIKTLIGDHGY